MFALLMEPVIPALLVGGKGLGHGGGEWWEGVFTHTDTHTVGNSVHTNTALFTQTHTHSGKQCAHTHTPPHTQLAPEP